MGFLFRIGKGPYRPLRRGTQARPPACAVAAASAATMLKYYINRRGRQTDGARSAPGVLCPRGPIVPGARLRTGRQIDRRGELGLARRISPDATQRQRAHLVFGDLTQDSGADDKTATYGVPT